MSYLDEEPGGDQRQAAVLAVEAVVVCIEGKVIQVEEPGTQQQLQLQCFSYIDFTWAVCPRR